MAFIPDENSPVMTVEAWEQKQADERMRRERAKADEERESKRKESMLPLKNRIDYTDELAEEICERISAGELLINILDEDHMPTVRRNNQWLKANPDYQQLYKESINDRLSIFEEQVIQIADDAAHDFKEIIKQGGKRTRVVDPEVIARAKLRVDVRFKHLKAGKPQKWGDSTTIITKDQDEFDSGGMSNEELEKKLDEIERKNKVVREV